MSTVFRMPCGEPMTVDTSEGPRRMAVAAAIAPMINRCSRTRSAPVRFGKRCETRVLMTGRGARAVVLRVGVRARHLARADAVQHGADDPLAPDKSNGAFNQLVRRSLGVDDQHGSVH